LTLEGVKIVLDCGHGAAYKSSPCVLRELGAEVIVFNNQPDGKNINESCGSMHPEAMCRKVVEHAAHMASHMTAMPTVCCFATNQAR
jgi:phosphoglucosamine mutase